MKKNLMILAMVVMMFVLGGCGQSQEVENEPIPTSTSKVEVAIAISTPTPTPTSEVEVVITTPTPTPTEVAVATSTPEPTKEPIMEENSITTEEPQYYTFDENKSPIYFYATISEDLGPKYGYTKYAVTIDKPVLLPKGTIKENFFVLDANRSVGEVVYVVVLDDGYMGIVEDENK